ncbi:MAG: DUF1285 domain-containing protein [Pseudomonadota bacterium]
MTRQTPEDPGKALHDLAASARRATVKGPPPVHLWNPPFCGNLDIRIASDGLWYYLGTPIGRQPLVNLFSSVIRRDGDDYFLVTPVEKIGITVDDAPFVAVSVAFEGEGCDQVITFTTNVGEQIVVAPDTALRFAPSPRDTDEPGEVIPYLHVRRRLDAKIRRPVFYEMVDRAAHHDVDGVPHFGIWASGVFYPMVPSSLLEGVS